MLTRSFRLVLALTGLVGAGLAGVASPAFADSQWEQTHQRRDEVNDRLAHQNARINEERREHEITRRRAEALHRQDVRTRNEERYMASRDRGHVTHQEQERLNHREDVESHEIGR